MEFEREFSIELEREFWFWIEFDLELILNFKLPIKLPLVELVRMDVPPVLLRFRVFKLNLDT